MESRGVQLSGTTTITSSLHGLIKSSPSAKAEFLDMVKISDGGKPI
jgi:GTP cyclohydrolase I